MIYFPWDKLVDTLHPNNFLPQGHSEKKVIVHQCKKRQMSHHAGQEIAEKAPTLGATEDVPDESVVE